MESEGPRLSVVFTNFSRFHEVQDNIMIPGIESVSKYETVDRFSELIKKFKNEICQKIYHDMGEKQSIKILQPKIDLLLPRESFYAFKIFPNQEDRMIEERKEISRLLSDVSKHGRRYAINFS